jgi:hypothetical protein
LRYAPSADDQSDQIRADFPARLFIGDAGVDRDEVFADFQDGIKPGLHSNHKNQ